MNTLFRKLRHVLRWSRHDDDLRQEIETHRSLLQAALERDGLGRDDAAHASRRAMGNVTLAVEDARDVWAIRAIDALRHDVRDAVRRLRKSVGFPVVVIGTLALGIGANTSLFSIFNSLILRPLPVRDPASLTLLDSGSWSYPVWQEIDSRASELFDGAFAWSAESFDVEQAGRALRVDGAHVSRRAVIPRPHVLIAQSAAARFRARAAGGRPDGSVRERHSTGGTGYASRAPPSRRGIESRREFGISLRETAADGRRVGQQQQGGGGRWTHASRRPATSRLA